MKFRIKLVLLNLLTLLPIASVSFAAMAESMHLLEDGSSGVQRQGGAPKESA